MRDVLVGTGLSHRGIPTGWEIPLDMIKSAGCVDREKRTGPYNMERLGSAHTYGKEPNSRISQ